MPRPENIVRRPVAAGNWRKGRRGDGSLDQIAVHVTEGSASSTREWFNDPAADVSAHFMVTRAGGIEQFVDVEDEAFHCGRVDRPTAPLVLARPNLNPNAYSVGIEHEGDGHHELTDPQRVSSVGLIRWLALDVMRIAIDRTHIVGHHEIYAKKVCPGVIDVSRLVAEAAQSERRADPPRVVYSPYLEDYLIVTRYVSESEWYFVPFKTVKAGGVGTRAGVALSAMALGPSA